MMLKKLAIVQSNYIPWKGYFDLIAQVDEFILYDDVQYTRRDWRNRNIIKSPAGPLWLTIPVEAKGRYLQKIKDTKVSEQSWREKHWRTICHNYAKARFFEDYADLFEQLYLGSHETYLSEINCKFIAAINQLLDITTKISWSSDYNLVGGKSERLVDLCQQAHAAIYLSGPAARSYIDEELFERNKITLSWMDYSGYPEYPQLYPPFTHQVSIMDLIFNVGPNARHFMKSHYDRQEASL